MVFDINIGMFGINKKSHKNLLFTFLSLFLLAIIILLFKKESIFLIKINKQEFFPTSKIEYFDPENTNLRNNFIIQIISDFLKNDNFSQEINQLILLNNNKELNKILESLQIYSENLAKISDHNILLSNRIISIIKLSDKYLENQVLKKYIINNLDKLFSELYIN
ncbi:MAG: hypothetical protein ISN64_01085 [Rickettsia sp.]|nr:hypothetical protein [Rickettsia sp.]